MNSDMKSVPRIIALCGRKRTGKDTVANYLCKEYDYKNVKFAEPLKTAVQAMFGFTYDQIENNKECVDKFWGVSPRNALKFFGCDIMQIEIQKLLPDVGRSFFVKSLLSKYPNDMIVISDMRFLHEYNAIKEIENTLVIKIIRNSVDDGDTHISETELDMIEGDFTINNNGDLDALEKQIKEILI